MDHQIEAIILGINTLISLAASVWAWKRRKESRQEELRILGEQSVDVAVANGSSGIPLRRTAFETAVLLDLKDGKRDFSREQLWASVEAAISRRGL